MSTTVAVGVLVTDVPVLLITVAAAAEGAVTIDQDLEVILPVSNIRVINNRLALIQSKRFLFQMHIFLN